MTHKTRRSFRRGLAAQYGFTLIEMVVAVVLVAAISVGMLSVFQTGLLTMDRTQASLEDNRRAVGTLDMIRRQVGGAMPARSLCQSGDHAGVDDVFRGDPGALLLATNESLTEGSRSYPRIVIYRFMANPDGSLRLIADERLFSGPFSTIPLCDTGSAISPVIGPSPITVMDHLAAGRFIYRDLDLGSLLARATETQGWMDHWDRPYLPFAIRIDVQPAPGYARRMPLGSITIPLHLSREPGGEYTSGL